MQSLHTRCTGLLTGALILSGAAFAQGGDDCSVPTAINGAGTWFYDTSTATTTAFDGGSGGIGCYNNINQDLFFAWTANVSGNYVIDTEGSSYDTKINVHAGGDCNATCIDGDDDGGTGLLSRLAVAGVNAGDVLLIQVGGFGTAFGAAQLNVTLAPPTPTNDTCATPDTTTLVGTGSYPFDTTSAFTSGFDGGGTCAAGAATINQDVFYTFTAPSTNAFVFDTVGSAFDTKISIHLGNDCNATCLAYNDDANGTLQSEIVLAMNAGDVVLVQLGGFGVAFGTGTLNISIPPPPPANDTCATPDTTTLVGTGTFPYDTTSALTSGFDGGAACANFGILDSDIFFTWTAPAAGDYTVNTFQTGYDTILAVHSGSDCNATCLGYNDQANGTAQSEVLLLGVNAGDQFLVQVGGWNGADGPGTLEIAPWVDPCAASGPDAFEPNDSCATAVAVGDGLYPGLNVSMTNSDFYAFTVADGATLNADIFFLQANADVDMFLYDASVCLDDTNSGTGGSLAFGFSATDNETLSWANTTGADLACILRVNVWPNSAGDCNDYDLQLSGAGPGGPTLFCDPANVNSSGNYVDLSSSSFSGPGVVHLEATGGPNAQFGYFLVSATTLNPGIPVSQGLICVGAPQGRYNGVGGLSSIGQFNASGVLNNIVGTSSVGTGFDVPASLPNPPGGVITPGSTFHFQLWYRDGVNSNFSNGLTVAFP